MSKWVAKKDDVDMGVVTKAPKQEQEATFTTPQQEWAAQIMGVLKEGAGGDRNRHHVEARRQGAEARRQIRLEAQQARGAVRARKHVGGPESGPPVPPPEALPATSLRVARNGGSDDQDWDDDSCWTDG